MPRIRPLRTKEEIDAVPRDKSVTISLEPEGVVDLGERDEPEVKVQGQQPPKKIKEPKVEPQEDDASDLRRQLDDMKRSKEEGDRRINEEIAARQAAEQRGREREHEASQSKIRAEDAEYDAILNAIGAAESEAESAQRDIAMSSEASDAKGVAEASRRLARAESRLVQLQDGKEAIERAKTAQAAREKAGGNTQQQQRVTNQQPTIEEYINQLPNLLQSQRDWLKAHPDALTDQRKNLRLQGAHVEAEDKGFRPGTAKYFTYLEERLGYQPAESDVDDEQDEPVTVVSAPPSRSGVNAGTGRPSNNKITLTPEQREMARLSGIDELTYARQLQKLQALKAEGHYTSN
jgi:DNA repair exonuclease SbcCD ATPase subunit